MGYKAWSKDAYSSLRASTVHKTVDEIFTSNSVDDKMSPKGIELREARDSDVHPNSLAIIVNLDETGSMGAIPEYLVKNKLGTLMETTIAHGVPDAQILFTGIGDHYSDRSPLQIGQFEAGTTELNEWLTKIYLEGRGGGQNMESYHLAWFFAGRYTSIDCFEKRNVKGFLFTIGDEWVHPNLEAAYLNELMGTDIYKEDLTAEQLLAEAQKMYHVFHLHITETSAGRDKYVQENWKKLLSERVIMVEDHKDVAEIIATTVAVVNGADIKDVVKSFDSGTADKVMTALARVDTGSSVAKVKKGVIKL